MDAVIRVFKRVTGLGEGDDKSAADAAAFCSMRLLVASTQAISLIGKQGSTIKSIQETTGAVVRILPEGLICYPSANIHKTVFLIFWVSKLSWVVVGSMQETIYAKPLAFSILPSECPLLIVLIIAAICAFKSFY